MLAVQGLELQATRTVADGSAASSRCHRRSAPELTVVVPTFRERDNVVPLIDCLYAVLEGISWEVLFVDDDSPDGTAALVKSIGASDARVRAIRRVGRRGLSGACLEGMLSSQAPFVAVMDADLQHDERLVPEMLAQLRSQAADIAIGTRYIPGGSASGFSGTRRSGSRLANFLARKLLKIPISDPMSGFFMMRRPLVEALAPRLSSRGFKILMDVLANVDKNTRVIELPYQFRSRQHGESKLDNRVILDFIELLTSRVTRGFVPDRLISFLLVGLSGILVHVSILSSLHVFTPALAFAFAQIIATLSAMVSNFFLNNSMTYRDQRLHGRAAVLGLILFSLICSVGIFSNIGVASWLYGQHQSWWLAGILGSIVSAVWNYAVSRTLVWRQ